jgi:hypothetical protein
MEATDSCFCNFHCAGGFLSDSQTIIPAHTFAEVLREKCPKCVSVPDDKLLQAFAKANPKYRLHYTGSKLVSVSWAQADLSRVLVAAVLEAPVDTESELLALETSPIMPEYVDCSQIEELEEQARRRASSGVSVARRFPLQTFLALVTFVAILFCVHRFGNHSKGVDPVQLPVLAHSLTEFDVRQTPLLPLKAASLQESETPIVRTTVSPLLQDNPGLDHFYEALWSTQKHERTGPVQIVHYGDSPTTADLITGDNRQQLQQQFGDAGHGYVLVAKPWAWYGHRGIEISSSGWEIHTAVGSIREGEYGLGGAVFQGSVGAYSRINLQDHTHTQMDIFFEAQPSGGSLSVSVNGKPARTIDTRSEARQPAFQRIDLPKDTGIIELRPTAGTVQLFGISFEKKEPGIIYDSLGLNGASTIVLSRVFRQKQWAEELQHRHPDLVIINYGTNESGYTSWIDKQYEIELRTAIQRVKVAVPQSSILIVSPMDRGERSGSNIHTMPGILHILKIQERVALDTGCGFFNTFEAMGGDSTMERWYDSQRRLA